MDYAMESSQPSAPSNYNSKHRTNANNRPTLAGQTVPSKFLLSKPPDQRQQHNIKLKYRGAKPKSELQKCIRPIAIQHNNRTNGDESNVTNTRDESCVQPTRNNVKRRQSGLYQICTAQEERVAAVSENEYLEDGFVKYLHEELLNSILEEENKLAQDLVADVLVVSSIESSFIRRERGILEAKNNALHEKVKDIEWCDVLNRGLSAIVILSNTNVDIALSQLTERLSEAIDVLPIINCTYKSSTPIDWKALESATRNLNTVLSSPEKPFYYLRTLRRSIEAVKKELESVERKKKQKLVLNQKLTFYTSLRLCYQLYQDKFQNSRDFEVETPFENVTISNWPDTN